jgi:hypothetical protein
MTLRGLIIGARPVTDGRRVDKEIPVRMGGMNLKERKPKKRKTQPAGEEESESPEKKKRLHCPLRRILMVDDEGRRRSGEASLLIRTLTSARMSPSIDPSKPLPLSPSLNDPQNPPSLTPSQPLAKTSSNPNDKTSSPNTVNEWAAHK